MAHDMLREKRATRGQRMSALVGKAAEEDEAFYNNELWQEGDDSENESYSEESEKPDVFDSDFNESEDDDDDEEDISDGDDDDRPKRSTYKDPKEKKKKKLLKKADEEGDTMDVEEVGENGEMVTVKQSKPKVRREKAVIDPNAPPPEPRMVRESTKVKTAENIAKQKSESETKVKIKREPKPKVTFEQDFLLKEALETEELNYRWLLRKKHNTLNAEAAEAELIQSSRKKKPPLKDFVRYHSSKTHGTLITFSSHDVLPAIVKGDLPQPTVPAKTCVITGLPAKYRDPKTMLPYANLEAYKELKRRLANGELSLPSHSMNTASNALSATTNGKKISNSSSKSRLNGLASSKKFASFSKSAESFEHRDEPMIVVDDNDSEGNSNEVIEID